MVYFPQYAILFDMLVLVFLIHGIVAESLLNLFLLGIAQLWAKSDVISWLKLFCQFVATAKSAHESPL